MTVIMPKLKGRADGKLVNQIVKDILQWYIDPLMRVF
jgi:uncharacterized protein YqeY